ncbi:major facilitator superfamily transporter [Xylariaceae sp. FL1019]|nr:major facilitator superfamily transporter [Xylariaceae sp. FL1019]
MASENYIIGDFFPDALASNRGEKRRRSSEADGSHRTPSSTDDIPISPAIESPQAAYTRGYNEKAAEDGQFRPVQSRASSMRSRHVVPVPRAKQRGFLSWLSVIPEVDRPYNYQDGTKWFITLVVAVAAAAAPMGSAIFYPSLGEISKDLHVSKTVVNLSVAVYMLSMSIFPLWWSSFSETLGRRNIYLVSFSLNAVFTVASGLSANIGQLIVFRILAGGAAASVQAVGAGTIADIWESRERGRAMGIFYLGPLCGPLLAPIIGGALADGFGWRSTMYFLAAYGALIVLLVLFALPETLARRRQDEAAAAAMPEMSQGGDPLSRTSTRRSVIQTRTKIAGAWFKRALIDPLSILKYLRFPAVALIVSYAAITFGSLYVLNICVQSAFSAPPYNYQPLIVGILYIPSSLGYFIASLLGGPWLDRIMEREARKAGRFDERGRLIVYPEDRMRENAWISATLYPGALIWFGWSVQNHLHWAVPSVANFFFGAGSMLVFSMATTMLTEFMPKKASSGVALNNFVRNILSATGAIVGQPLIGAIGFGWLCTGLALIAFIAGNSILFAIRKNSTKWRIRMNAELD